jgi:hypothetical protein
MHNKNPNMRVLVEGLSKATFDGSRTSRVSMALIPLALWIWLCRDWPTRLGFYSDDWIVLLHPIAGTTEAFRDILNLTATRPVSAPYIWLAQVITDWSPTRSQILNAAMLLLTAGSVGVLTAALSSVVRGLRCGVFVGACIASATFVVFPSNVGTFAWGIGVSTAIPALPLFCFSVSLLLRSEDSWWRFFLGLALALLSHLSYEAFYFQEITFLLLVAVLRGSTIKEIPWRALAGAVFINVACLAFNRLTPGGIQKSFHWDFIHIFIGGYSHIPAILGHAAREHKFLIAGTVLVAGLSGALCLARLVGVSRVWLAFLLMAGGIVASGLLYASAGYGLAAEGVMARVSIVIATCYAVIAGVLAAAAWCRSGQNRLPAAAFYLAAATGLVALEQTARARTSEWAENWSHELARLSRLPAIITSGDKLSGGNQRIYLAIEDSPQLSIAVATAPWEITGAVAWASYQITNNRLLTIDLWKQPSLYHWFATPRGWFNRWDGSNFEQGPCNGPAAYGRSASELWSWNSSTGELSKVFAPWEHGCQLVLKR